jgi:hypothetical protein
MIVAAAYIQSGWIYSSRPEQSGKYWIHGDWVWGPLGAADVNTSYWINDGWIWGPVGAPDPTTGFYIADGFIYGPSEKLPFAR